MGEYTESLQALADELSFDNDNYEAVMLDIAARFHTRSAALSDFICRRGYKGSPEDAKAKVTFLQEKCRAAGIESPRDMTKWFTQEKNFERKAAFQLCFALGLNLEETDEFFQKVFFDRSLDYHTVKELVYAYCLRCGRTYTEAEALFARIPVVEVGKKIDLAATDILYTCAIKDAIEGIESDEDLIAYVQEHAAQFRYNNTTAMQQVQSLWKKLTDKSGLINQETICEANSRVEEIIAFSMLREENHNESEMEDSIQLEELTLVSPMDNSTWDMLCKILGLDMHTAALYKELRSIKPIISGNPLMPALAEAMFPSSEQINAILRGKHIQSYEIIRKWLILLAFYFFWSEIIVSEQEPAYAASAGDAERCESNINMYLMKAGFAALYYGNPYDWIFLWAMKKDQPLMGLREYIVELHAYQSERLEQMNAAKPSD